MPSAGQTLFKADGLNYEVECAEPGAFSAVLAADQPEELPLTVRVPSTVQIGEYTVPVTGIRLDWVNDHSLVERLVLPSSVRVLMEMTVPFAADVHLKALEVGDDHPLWRSEDGVLMTRDRSTLLFCPPARTDTLYISEQTVRIAPGFVLGGPCRVPDMHPVFESEDGILYARGKAFLLACPPTCGGTFVVAEQVQEIGTCAFWNTPQIKRFKVEAGNRTFVEKDGVLFTRDSTVLCAFPGKKSGTYRVPLGVTSVRPAAFAANRGVRTLIFQSPLDASLLAPLLCRSVREIRLPGLSGDMERAVCSSPQIPFSGLQKLFWGCMSLEEVCVTEPSSTLYTVDGVVYGTCRTAGGRLENSLLFCPVAKKGRLYIDKGTEQINGYACRKCRRLTSVVFPQELRCISFAAFEDCDGLSGLKYLPENISIEEYAFAGCSALAEVGWPASIREMGLDALAGTKWLRGQPDGVVCVSDIAYGFKGEMPADYTLSLPDHIRTVTSRCFSPLGRKWGGEHVFSLFRLNQVVVPARMQTITPDVFAGCERLQSFVSLSASGPLSVVEGVLFDRGGTRLLIYPAGKESEVYGIPSSVEMIARGAFSSAKNLKQVEIPASVREIAENAFISCSSLAKVLCASDQVHVSGSGVVFSNCLRLDSAVFSSDVQNAGDLFRGCTALANIDFGNGVTDIADRAFEGCTSLKQVKWSRRLRSVGRMAFYGCVALETIVLPDSLADLQEGCFMQCRSLKTLVLPLGLERMDANPFAGCDRLKTIHVAEDNSRYRSYNGVLYADREGEKELILYPADREGVAYTVEAGTKVIGAFAFEGCRKLESVNLRDEVYEMRTHPFGGCERLKELIVQTELPPMTKNAFLGPVGDRCKLMVPKGCAANYMMWQRFFSVIEEE